MALILQIVQVRVQNSYCAANIIRELSLGYTVMKVASTGT